MRASSPYWLLLLYRVASHILCSVVLAAPPATTETRNTSAVGNNPVAAEAPPSTTTANGHTMKVGAMSILPASGPSLKGAIRTEKKGIRWDGVLRQSGLLYGMSVCFRLAAQGDTRAALRGRFWADYIDSLRGLGGWGDDDPPIANYVAHPIEGSTCMWILIHNDPEGAHEFDLRSRGYWGSRMKGTAFSAAYRFLDDNS